MKTSFIIILSFLLFGVSFASMWEESKFMITELASPQCLINGETITYTGQNRSDTSSWHMLEAYQWECILTPALSQEDKEKIFKIVDMFFQKQSFYKEKSLYNALNDNWREFVLNKYFPAIRDILVTEKNKAIPNLTRMAVFEYAADIIGYDYEIKQSQK